MGGCRYTGDLFGAETPPSYSESLDAGSPEFGITPNHAVNNAAPLDPESSQPDIGGGFNAAELEQYLALEESVGYQ